MLKKKLEGIEQSVGIEYDYEEDSEDSSSEEAEKKPVSYGPQVFLLVFGALLALLGLTIIGIPLAILGVVLIINKHSSNKNNDDDQAEEYEEASSEDDNSSTVSKSSKDYVNFEVDLGINWFSKIGILALVIGVGLFIKYAIDMNWINEHARILGSIIFGFALVVAAKFISKKEKYQKWSMTLAGGGFAITYFAVYASYYFEEYKKAIGMPFEITIALFSFIVLVIVLYSINENSKVLAYQAFLLGYITTFLAGDMTLLSLIYTVFLSLGFFAVSLYKKWKIFGLVGVIVSYFWVLLSFNDALSVGFVMSVLAVYFILFNVLAYSFSKPKIFVYTLLVFLSNSILFYITTLYVASFGFDNYYALITLIFAALHAILFAFYSLKNNSEIYTTNIYLFCTYLILSVPLHFQGFILLIIWCVFLFLLMLIYKLTNLSVFKIISFFVTLFVVILSLASELQKSDAIFSFLFVIASFYGVYFLFKDEKSKSESDVVANISGLYSILGFIFTIIYVYVLHYYTSLNFEGLILIFLAINILFYFIGMNIFNRFTVKTKILSVILYFNALFFVIQNSSSLALYQIMFFIAPVLVFGYILAYVAHKVKDGTTNLEYSIVSTIFVIILIFVKLEGAFTSLALSILAIFLLLKGFLLKIKQYRVQSMLIFSFVILKVFLYDTRDLDNLYRTLSYILLGVLLLSISFFYTKFKGKLKNLI
ncbi:MAG: DUF2339 domain-containing protein [Candidatus Woesearchaeota archaeon]